MAERSHVGQHQLLLRHINIVYIRTVDDKALTDADEVVALATQLVGNHLLYLPQLKGEHAHLAISLHECRVVAVRCDVYDALRCYAHQVYRCGYDELFLHSQAKVARLSETTKSLRPDCTKWSFACMKSQNSLIEYIL